ncbi:MAG TPA: DUF2804 domain-containing protein [Anaerolineaceae bacterium]
MTAPQQLLRGKGPLLKSDGSLADVGWSNQPLLDANLEDAHFYRTFGFWQRFRLKRWDYYSITTPTHFFSFTLADIGYLGQVFAYGIDFATQTYHEETLSIPLAKGVHIPRGSQSGVSWFDNGRTRMKFEACSGARSLWVDWPAFQGKGLSAQVQFDLPPEHESMNIVIPIRGNRFYYNRKINCMPARGWVQWGGQRFELAPDTALGGLDWGRGVWEYKSFWVWASASGFLPGGRTVGLNLGFGFGDTSKASENALILDGRIHKLGKVDFDYSNRDFRRPWQMRSDDGRLELTFTPFLERVARTDMKVLSSEVHQMFGRYVGSVISDDGEKIRIDGLTGFAEEHHAKW